MVEILSGYVELAQPATSRDVKRLLDLAEGAAKAELERLSSNYSELVLGKRVSVLDILEEHSGSIKISFAEFLDMLPSMRIRQYSISSSPLWNAEHVTLTVSVLDAPALANSENTFLGVASNYLAQLSPGDRILVSTRPSAAVFSLPSNPSVPMVMFCAGSGLAPMRGFIQERALQKEAGRDVGKVTLFYGCRSPDMDYLYSMTDLAEWTKLGFLDVRPAFSRAAEKSEGCPHIQE